MCGCLPNDPFVSFGAKPTQRACTRNLSRDRKWTREGRSERGQKDSQKKGTKEDNRQKRSVQGMTQSAEGSSRDQSTEQGKNESAFLVALWEFSLEYTFALAHRMSKKCQTSPSCAWGWPKSVFVHLFFSSTLSVMFCVSVKECEIPPVRDEKNH